MESYQFEWDDINLDHITELSETFDIDSDVLDLQKLELSVSIQNYRTDLTKTTSPGMVHGHGGSAGPGGTGHGGHIVSTGQKSDVAEDTPTAVATELHVHEFETDAPIGGVDADDVEVATGDHTHPVGTYVIGGPSATISVATHNHTHPPGSYSALASGSGTNNAITSLGSSSCTAVNCTKTFFACITGTIPVIASAHTHNMTGSSGATTTTTTVASNSHIHTLSGSSGVPSATVWVPNGDHVHLGTTLAVKDVAGATISLDALGHTHPISGKETDAIGDILLPAIADTTPTALDNITQIEYHEVGSTPEMYLVVELDGSPISGSPFVIGEAGAYDGNEISDKVGPVSIADNITTTGSHAVSVSLSNKSSPGDPCKVMASVRINGRFFVSTITT